VSGAIGGENIGEVVDGRARYPINLRYPREVRDTLERLIALPIVTDEGLRLTLGEVGARRDCRWPVDDPQRERTPLCVCLCRRARDAISRPWSAICNAARRRWICPGVSVAYSGQFEYLERAAQRLIIVGPGHAGHHFPVALRNLPPL
jgi:Cu(I)/Ag(I) efflux system membrane protein CusA/SilA